MRELSKTFTTRPDSAWETSSFELSVPFHCHLLLRAQDLSHCAGVLNSKYFAPICRPSLYFCYVSHHFHGGSGATGSVALESISHCISHGLPASH